MRDPAPPETGLLITDGANGLLKLRRFVIRVVAGPDTGLEHTLESGTVLVGTHPNNDLVLTDTTASRYHLEIQARAGGIFITDLDSTNGTYLGETRLGSVTVRVRSRLRVGGETKLEVIPADEVVDVAPFKESYFGKAYGVSSAMTALFSLLNQVSHSEVTVLLEGETGTGKELLAEGIHAASPRRDGPFVVLDCGAMARELMAAELFGHARGAFTGATGAKLGLAEAASGGTLLLDEVGELPLELQPHLLRLLEKREVRRIGETQPRRVDVRVVAATNRDLASLVHDGAFREDLFYRLAVVRLEVPPLRKRLEDIPGLVALFLREIGQADFDVPTAIMDQLYGHRWPGNVRELGNVVQRGLALATSITPCSSVGGESLSTLEHGSEGDASSANVSSEVMELPFKEAKGLLMESFEREYLERLLSRHDGNISRAAQEAGIDRNYIHRLVRRYNIPVPGR